MVKVVFSILPRRVRPHSLPLLPLLALTLPPPNRARHTFLLLLFEQGARLVIPVAHRPLSFLREDGNRDMKYVMI